MTTVRLDAVRKQFGSFVAIENIDLEIESGELVALLGPSGCGKTTTLRMIAGLEKPTAGAMRLFGETVSRHDPRHFARSGIARAGNSQPLLVSKFSRRSFAFLVKGARVSSSQRR